MSMRHVVLGAPNDDIGLLFEMLSCRAHVLISNRTSIQMHINPKRLKHPAKSPSLNRSLPYEGRPKWRYPQSIQVMDYHVSIETTMVT